MMILAIIATGNTSEYAALTRSSPAVRSAAIGERGWLGLDAGERARGLHHVRAHRELHDERDQAGEDGSDEGAGGEQLEPSAGTDRVGERGARSESCAGEEGEDPELAQDEVGGPWDLPRDRAGARDRAEAQADDQRSAPGPELDPATTGQRDVDDAEQQPGGDAEREPERVDLGQSALGVAERPGRLVDAARRTDHTHPVAELEDDVVVAQQVVVATRGLAVAITPKRPGRSRSPIRSPARRRSETRIRRKSNVDRSSGRW